MKKNIKIALLILGVMVFWSCELLLPPRTISSGVQPIQGAEIEFKEDVVVFNQVYLDDHLVEVLEQSDGSLHYVFNEYPEGVRMVLQNGARGVLDSLWNGATVVFESCEAAAEFTTGMVVDIIKTAESVTVVVTKVLIDNAIKRIGSIDQNGSGKSLELNLPLPFHSDRETLDDKGEPIDTENDPDWLKFNAGVSLNTIVDNITYSVQVVPDTDTYEFEVGFRSRSTLTLDASLFTPGFERIFKFPFIVPVTGIVNLDITPRVRVGISSEATGMVELYSEDFARYRFYLDEEEFVTDVLDPFEMPFEVGDISLSGSVQAELGVGIEFMVSLFSAMGLFVDGDVGGYLGYRSEVNTHVSGGLESTIFAGCNAKVDVGARVKAVDDFRDALGFSSNVKLSTSITVWRFDQEIYPFPTGPTSLLVESVPGGVLLSWQRAQSSFDMLRVERAPITGTFSTLDFINDCYATTYTDLTVAPGETYLYRIIGLRGSLLSTPTNEVDVTISSVDSIPPAEVSSLQAIPGDGQVTLKWSNPPDSDFYSVEILYGIEVADTVYGGIINPSGTIVGELANGNNYKFKIQTKDTSGNTSDGVVINAIPTSTTSSPLLPPTSISATDGIYQDRVLVTWTNSSGADSYVISRSDTVSGVKTVLASSISGTSLNDYSADDHGGHHYYWVQSKKLSGEVSEYSAYDEGSRKYVIPAVSGLTASKGTFTDRINISWNAVSSATEYRLWRKASTDSAWTRNWAIPASSSPQFTDTSGLVGGVDYQYKVQVWEAGVGYGPDSVIEVGFLDTSLDTPQNVIASNDIVSHVEIHWSAVANAHKYSIYRATEYSGLYSEIGSVSSPSTSYQDTNAAADGTMYYYKVRAYNITWDKYSTDSNIDAGSRDFLPHTPANVRATDGAYLDRVRVTWNATTGAERYKVYRSTSQNGTYTIESPSIDASTTYYDDYDASYTGTVYWYKVKAYNDTYNTDSELSIWDSGYRIAGNPPAEITTLQNPPPNPFVWNTNYTSEVMVKNTSSVSQTLTIEALEPSGWSFTSTSVRKTIAPGYTAQFVFTYYFYGISNRYLDFTLKDDHGNVLDTYRSPSISPSS